MSSVIKNLLKAARHFSGTDFAIFKICLLTIGILLGIYFYSFFIEYISIIWVIAILSWLILMFNIIRYYKRMK